MAEIVIRHSSAHTLKAAQYDATMLGEELKANDERAGFLVRKEGLELEALCGRERW